VLPHDDEVTGLYALLLFQHSRREARLDSTGDLVPLADQDRSLWDRELIARGRAALSAARATGAAPGWYRLQAEIAETHVVAATAEDTDWDRIVNGYDALLRIRSSAVVALNRVVAIGFRDNPVVALAELDRLTSDGSLAEYPLLPAVRADLLRRAGRRDEAVLAYQDAVDLADTAAERRFLQRRLVEL
jgi:RNA polymerase sigma-70 factor (ECF subfamily)